MIISRNREETAEYTLKIGILCLNNEQLLFAYIFNN